MLYRKVTLAILSSLQLGPEAAKLRHLLVEKILKEVLRPEFMGRVEMARSERLISCKSLVLLPPMLVAVT